MRTDMAVFLVILCVAATAMFIIFTEAGINEDGEEDDDNIIASITILWVVAAIIIAFGMFYGQIDSLEEQE